MTSLPLLRVIPKEVAVAEAVWTPNLKGRVDEPKHILSSTFIEVPHVIVVQTEQGPRADEFVSVIGSDVDSRIIVLSARLPEGAGIERLPLVNCEPTSTEKLHQVGVAVRGADDIISVNGYCLTLLTDS
jgi:hypothetical protein